MSELKKRKVIIIGSGPAGWTAAIYAARASLNPLCIIGVPKTNPAPVLPGGQLMLTTEVENYPGFPSGITGPDMMALFQKQAEKFGTDILQEDVISISTNEYPFVLHTSQNKELLADSIIISTGATANWLGLDNEIRLATTGGGVSACAVCDGALPVFRNKPLAVVGGGDTAMEEAAYLTKFASHVHIIHRRDTLRASKTMQQRILDAPNASVEWNSQVIDILGKDRIESVILEDTNTKQRRQLDVSGLFIAIGHTPATGFLEGSNIDLDASGYLKLKSHSTETNIEGIFGAGDVADSVYRQAITAAGMGCQAALDAERWLSERN